MKGLSRERIVGLLRSCGTGTVVAAMLDRHEGAAARRNQAIYLAALTQLLEKKKIIRRGHVVELLCASSGLTTEPEVDKEG
jgi:hypothetical protein